MRCFSTDGFSGCTAFLVSLLLLWCGGGCESVPVEPAGKYVDYHQPDSARFLDHPRWEFDVRRFDIQLVSILRDSASKWSGIRTWYPGTCHAVPAYHIIWTPEGSQPEDTLRIDAWLTTRCGSDGPSAVYTKARFFMDLASARLRPGITVRANIGGLTQWVVVSESVGTLRYPPDSCDSIRFERRYALSRAIDIPYLFECESFRPDSVRATFEMIPPITSDDHTYPPLPILFGIELWDRTTQQWDDAVVYVGTHSE